VREGRCGDLWGLDDFENKKGQALTFVFCAARTGRREEGAAREGRWDSGMVGLSVVVCVERNRGRCRGGGGRLERRRRCTGLVLLLVATSFEHAW
jgi:hypothetical protein